MQVQLTMTFDASETPDLANRLETIIHAAGNVTVVPASGKKSPDPQQQPISPGDPSASGLMSADALKAQRQAQAANARAAKANKDRVSGAAQQAPVDLSGTNGVGDQAEGDDPDAADDMGLVPPSMSPGEARDAALVLVREAYSSGHTAEVKALQKQLNVAKFYDVPPEDGHKFYQQAMKLAQGVGIRQ